MCFIQEEDLPCLLAQVESVQESIATVQNTLQHLQGELHEGFHLLKSEMETGREQASQETRSLSFQISQLLEFWTSPNVEIQLTPSPYPSSENCGQPQIYPSCPGSFCGFPLPHRVLCHPKLNLIAFQNIQIWGKSIRLENFLMVSQKFTL